MLLASLDDGLLAAAPQAISVDFDATFLVQLVLFVGLTLVLKPLLFDPMLKLFEERERRIDGAKLQARKIDEKSAGALTKYETEMAKARAAANAEREKIRAEGLKREQEILGAVRAADRQDHRGRQARRPGRGRARARRPEGEGTGPGAGPRQPRARARGAVVKRRPVVRRVALAAMVAVTAWSVWAWAQRRPAAAAARERAGAEEAAATGARARAEARAGPAPINWTDFGGETPPFIAMLINFGILAAGYYFLGKKPIAAALQTRRDTIAKEIEEAQRMKHEAEARAKTYQSKLENLEDELRATRDVPRARRRGRARAHRARGRGEGRAHAQGRGVPRRAGAEADPRSTSGARRSRPRSPRPRSCCKKRVTPADQERLAEDYLADLGSSQGRPSSRARPAPARRRVVSVSIVARRYAQGAARARASSGHARRARRRDEHPRRRLGGEPRAAQRLENPLVAHAAKKAVIAELADRLGVEHDDAQARAAPAGRPPPRARRCPYVAQLLRELADARKGVLRAEVTTAAPLTEAYYARLQAQLEKMTGQEGRRRPARRPDAHRRRRHAHRRPHPRRRAPHAPAVELARRAPARQRRLSRLASPAPDASDHARKRRCSFAPKRSPRSSRSRSRTTRRPPSRRRPARSSASATASRASTASRGRWPASCSSSRAT